MPFSSLLRWPPAKKKSPDTLEVDMKLGDDKTETEVRIEKDGDLNALQRYRYVTYFCKTGKHSDLSY